MSVVPNDARVPNGIKFVVGIEGNEQFINDLTASGLTISKIRLKWTAQAATYLVQRRETSTATWSDVETVTRLAGVAYYESTGLNEGTSYTYRLFKDGSTTPSNTAVAETYANALPDVVNPPASNGQVRQILAPEVTHDIDFETENDKVFFYYLRDYTEYGALHPETSGTTGPKVLRFDYETASAFGDHAIAEARFKLRCQAVQVTMTWDQFIPSNYTTDHNNMKMLEIWSGEYGSIQKDGRGNKTVQIGIENWPHEQQQDKARPSMNIFNNRRNYGHSYMNPHRVSYTQGEGAWHTFHFFLQLATAPGQYGLCELYKDGELLMGSDHPEMQATYHWRLVADPPRPVNTQIDFAPTGNFVDQGYILGHMNGGGRTLTQFGIDNVRVRCRSTFGETFLAQEIA